VPLLAHSVIRDLWLPLQALVVGVLSPVQIVRPVISHHVLPAERVWNCLDRSACSVLIIACNVIAVAVRSASLDILLTLQVYACLNASYPAPPAWISSLQHVYPASLRPRSAMVLAWLV
jgi:hypothetical protein